MEYLIGLESSMTSKMYFKTLISLVSINNMHLLKLCNNCKYHGKDYCEEQSENHCINYGDHSEEYCEVECNEKIKPKKIIETCFNFKSKRIGGSYNPTSINKNCDSLNDSFSPLTEFVYIRLHIKSNNSGVNFSETSRLSILNLSVQMHPNQIDQAIHATCINQIDQGNIHATCIILSKDNSCFTNFLNCLVQNEIDYCLHNFQITIYVPPDDHTLLVFLYGYFSGNWFSQGDILFLNLSYCVEMSIKLDAVLSLRTARELLVNILIDIAVACYVVAIDSDGFKSKLIQITQEAAYNTATLGIETAVQAFGNAVAGAAISGVVDVAFSSASIYLAKRRRDKGEMSEKEFSNKVKKTVFESSLKFVGGTTGSIIGQALIPVPIVGAVVGGFCGSLIGSGISKGINYGIFSHSKVDEGQKNFQQQHNHSMSTYIKKKQYVPLIIIFNESKNCFEEKKFERYKKTEKNDVKKKQNETGITIAKPFFKIWANNTIKNESAANADVPIKTDTFDKPSNISFQWNRVGSNHENLEVNITGNLIEKNVRKRSKTKDDSSHNRESIKSLEVDPFKDQKKRTFSFEDNSRSIKEKNFLQTSFGNVKEKWHTLNTKFFEESQTNSSYTEDKTKRDDDDKICEQIIQTQENFQNGCIDSNDSEKDLQSNENKKFQTSQDSNKLSLSSTGERTYLDSEDLLGKNKKLKSESEVTNSVYSKEDVKKSTLSNFFFNIKGRHAEGKKEIKIIFSTIETKNMESNQKSSYTKSKSFEEQMNLNHSFQNNKFEWVTSKLKKGKNSIINRERINEKSVPMDTNKNYKEILKNNSTKEIFSEDIEEEKILETNQPANLKTNQTFLKVNSRLKKFASVEVFRRSKETKNNYSEKDHLKRSTSLPYSI